MLFKNKIFYIFFIYIINIFLFNISYSSHIEEKDMDNIKKYNSSELFFDIDLDFLNINIYSDTFKFLSNSYNKSVKNFNIIISYPSNFINRLKDSCYSLVNNFLSNFKDTTKEVLKHSVETLQPAIEETVNKSVDKFKDSSIEMADKIVDNAIKKAQPAIENTINNSLDKFSNTFLKTLTLTGGSILFYYFIYHKFINNKNISSKNESGINNIFTNYYDLNLKDNLIYSFIDKEKSKFSSFNLNNYIDNVTKYLKIFFIYHDISFNQFLNINYKFYLYGNEQHCKDFFIYNILSAFNFPYFVINFNDIINKEYEYSNLIYSLKKWICINSKNNKFLILKLDKYSSQKSKILLNLFNNIINNNKNIVLLIDAYSKKYIKDINKNNSSIRPFDNYFEFNISKDEDFSLFINFYKDSICCYLQKYNIALCELINRYFTNDLLKERVLDMNKKNPTFNNLQNLLNALYKVILFDKTK